ncbi:MAG: tetratricopeptide repeat protein [Chitinivibrionales bacterium]|nr:tetratricopeptide repeat protein [Chitinivibrionales bacterium]
MFRVHFRFLSVCLYSICIAGFAAFLPAAPEESDSSAQGNSSLHENSNLKSTTILIARPEDASFDEKDENKWFAVLSEALFYFKFSATEHIDVIPWDTLNNNIRQFKNLSRRLAEPDYRDLIQLKDVGYMIFQNYEIIKGNVQYLAELISVDENRAVSVFESTFPTGSLPHELDSCIRQFHSAAGVKLTPEHARFLRTPLLSGNEKILKQFSEILLDDLYGKSGRPLEMAEEYRKIVKRDVLMYLAHYYAARHFVKAEKHYNAAVGLDNLLVTIGPFYPELYVAAARSYRLAGNYDDAIRIAILGEKGGMDTIKLALEKARAFEARRDTEKAKSAYRGVLDKDDDNVSALLFFAQYFNNHNKHDDALSYAEKLLAHDPANGPAYLEKGKSLFRLGKEDAALKAFDRTVRFLDDNPVPHKYLGQIYAKKENYEKAADHFRIAMKEMPNDFLVHLNAALSLRKTGKHKEAYEILRKIEPNFSNNSELQKEMGLLELFLNDTASARNHLNRFIAGGGKDSSVFLAMGYIHLGAKEYDRALEMFSSALPLVKDKNSCRLALARLSLIKENPRKAIAYLDSIVAEKPKYKETHRYLGDAWLSLGKREKALSNYLLERKYHGDSPYLRQNIADLNYALGNRQTAENEYMELVKKDKTNGEAFYRLALLSLKQKNFKSAEEYFTTASVLKKPTPEIYHEFGEKYAEFNMNSKAIDFYTKSLSIDSDHEASWLKLADLYTKTNNDSAAAEAYAGHFSLDPRKNKESIITAGDLFVKARKENSAQKCYRTFLDKNFENPHVNFKLAGLEYEDKDYKEVIELLRGLSGAWGSDIRVITMLADSYYRLNDYKMAQKYLSQALVKKPSDQHLIELSAIASDSTGNYKNAVRMYEKYLEKGASNDYGFRLARLYEKTGRREDALERYAANTRYYPSDLRNHERLAELYMAKKRYKSASRVLYQAIKVKDAPPRFTRMLARALEAQNQKTNAAKYYEQYVKEVPTDTSGLLELGELYYHRSQYDKAIPHLNQASVLTPRNFRCHSMLGAAYLKSKKYKSAVDPLERAHKLDPEHQETIEQLAVCYRKLNSRKELAGVLVTLIKKKPTDHALHQELGLLYLSLDKPDDAVPVLKTAVRMKPSDVQSLNALAGIHKERKNDEKRLSYLTEAVKHSPKDFNIRFSLGSYYLERKQLDKAYPHLKEAVLLKPKNAKAHFSYGEVLFAQGENTAANTHFRLAAKHDPLKSRHFLRFAQTSHLIGKNSDALKSIRQALLLDGRDPEILFWAGKLLKKADKPDSAYTMLEKAADRNRGCDSCYILLGEIAYEQTRYDRAEDFFRKALDIAPDNEYVNLHYGKALLKNGKKDKALQTFEVIWSKNPTNDEALYYVCTAYISDGKLFMASELMKKRPNRKGNGWYYLTKGLLAEKQDKIKKAELSYSSAVRMLPANAQALAGYGRIHLRRGRYDQAVVNFGKALGIDPNNLGIILDLGNAYEAQKSYSSAVELYQTALKSNPEYHQAHFAIARVEGKRKNHLKSITALKNALDIDRRNPLYHMALGHEYRLTSQYKDAIKQYKRATRFGKDSMIDAYRYIGNIYYSSLKNKSKAKKFYEKYVNKGGENRTVTLRLHKIQ